MKLQDNMTPRAAYIHVPFCRQRCGYCNFTVVAGHDTLESDYLRALELELQDLQQPRTVDTLFIGGGTPTQLSPGGLQRLCQLVQHWFPPAENHEWSVEANPDGLTREKVSVLKNAGVTRISLGAQSFDAAKLQFLQRTHRPSDTLQAYQLCRETFASVSLDLIYAVPQESLAQWQADIEQATKLRPDHLSLYGLTFEKGAPLWSDLAAGRLQELGDQQQRVLYEWAIDHLVDIGFEHYEVSNLARPGHRCRHNMAYWTGDEYYAAGPGAARYVAGRRETNHRSTFTYIRRMLAGQSPVAQSESLAAEARAREQLVFSLRMLDGVDRTEFAGRSGYEIDALVGRPLARFIEWGLIEERGSRLRLTREGLLVSDSLWPDFL